MFDQKREMVFTSFKIGSQNRCSKEHTFYFDEIRNFPFELKKLSSLLIIIALLSGAEFHNTLIFHNL